MASIYFDITNIIDYAQRNSTVIGIPRVQLNIISLLSRKHGSQIRCAFFDYKRRVMREFDPAELNLGFEFNSENLLHSLNLLQASRFPSKGQVKGYLRQFAHNKVLRTWKKIDVYCAAAFSPARLAKMGLRSAANASQGRKVNVADLGEIPVTATYVCLGAIWMFSELWAFGRAHKQRGGAVIQLVYDLIPFRFPEYYTPREPPAFANWINEALEYTTRFACISKWTDNDLREYATKRGHTVVSKPVPLAHEFGGFDRTTPATCTANVASLENVEYVLCVGSIEHRKNNLALLRIWQQLRTELPSLPLLVFAGKYGRGGAEFQAALAADAELTKSVRLIHSPSDADLAWLYQHCLFTAFPSQFEGWGLPVGEAAWFGKYTVATNATSVPEVCGDLIDYVDPFDVESIKAGIKKPLTDRTYLRQREAAIRSATLRSWQDVADDIYEFVVRH